jgi:hypothetical protein
MRKLMQWVRSIGKACIRWVDGLKMVPLVSVSSVSQLPPSPDPRNDETWHSRNTGMKDSAGREIMEGDILRRRGKKVSYMGRVEWDTERKKFRVRLPHTVHEEFNLPESIELGHVIRTAMYVLVMDKDMYNDKIL